MPSLLRVSEASSLGLHTMVLLTADQDKLVNAKDAANLMGVSAAHLAKVLQRLARAGLVDSVRGPKGGFMLARRPETITLLEVYEAIEGSLEVRHCLFSTKLCTGEECIFGHILESVDAQVREYLTKTKLTEVVDTVQAGLEQLRQRNVKTQNSQN